MSDDFHKRAVLKKKKKNCKLKLHSKGLYQQLMSAASVLKYVQSLALDFPDICLQLFVGNFSPQEETFFTHNTVYFHAVTYLSRWPPKP